MSDIPLTLEISPEKSLSRYLQAIRQYPMLEQQEEFDLAKRWVDQGDVKPRRISW